MIGKDITYGEFMTLTLWFSALSMAVFFAIFWVRRSDRQRREEREERQREFELRKAEVALAASAADRSVDSTASPGSGGYIVIDMPDDQKSMFHDVLKGFEEYAKLKGYSISFSLDGSLPDKVAFKFTILDQGITVSTKTVQADLKDYIRRVHDGDNLDDLPVILPDAEHAALILAMRNRINFLQHTYTAQRNVVGFYERILSEGAARSMGVVPAQNFYLQGGGSMSPSNYTAIGSQNVAQGKDIAASHNVVDQSVHIAESFNEKKQQLDNLEALITTLTQAHPTATQDSKRAVLNLEKVKDELTTEQKPDASRIKKWLETAQASIKAIALGKDALDLAKKTFDGFQLPF